MLPVSWGRKEQVNNFNVCLKKSMAYQHLYCPLSFQNVIEQHHQGTHSKEKPRTVSASSPVCEGGREYLPSNYVNFSKLPSNLRPCTYAFSNILKSAMHSLDVSDFNLHPVAWGSCSRASSDSGRTGKRHCLLTALQWWVRALGSLLVIISRFPKVH